MANKTLTPAQQQALTLASEKPTLAAEDLPQRGAARQKALAGLLNKGLIEPTDKPSAFRISNEGMATLGKAALPKRRIRPGTKLHQVITTLSNNEGASLQTLMTMTGWQQHTVRGTIAGSLKKRLGLTVVSEKNDDNQRLYRITGGLETLDMTGETP